MSEAVEKQDLVMRHVFDASVAQVWQAWTDAALIQQWWGPDGFTCPVAELDVRVGGSAFLGMANPQFGTHYSLWEYQEIVPMERLVFIHNLADADRQKVDPQSVGMPPEFPIEQRQVIEFKAVGETQTEVIVTEYAWTVGQMMEMSRMGMEQCLAKMAKLF